ncbi:MAG TPA: GntR family transcriptional regulator [Chloroflexi bacterium]|nr:GntR family transcriptional regulator [Chloroflexota bacterium]
MINRNSKLPYYYQLYEILRGQILRGEWQPGQMLPTETELLEQYQVSRATVRQALDMLVNEGLIYRQRGRGTFVSHPTIEQGLSRIISFTEDMRQRGLKPGTVVLAARIVPAPEEIAVSLQIEPGDELANLVRLRLADGEPMSIEDSYLVHRYCPGILSRDYAKNSLRQVLEMEYGLRLVYARQKIRAVAASRELAEKLSVSENDALLYIERISYTDREIPVEFLRIHHRGDRYTLYNELRD